MVNLENIELSELILRCREGDDLAFDEMLRRYTPMIKGVISGFSSSPFDYGELFSEACVALHRAVGRYDLGQSEVTFGLYARVCVYNRIVDLIRSDEAKRKVVSYDGESISEDFDSVETGIIEREAIERAMASARDLLSDYEYRVLILHIQGYKTASISKMLSRTPKSIDNAKSRVFRRLREAINKFHN